MSWQGTMPARERERELSKGHVLVEKLLKPTGSSRLAEPSESSVVLTFESFEIPKQLAKCKLLENLSIAAILLKAPQKWFLYNILNNTYQYMTMLSKNLRNQENHHHQPTSLFIIQFIPQIFICYLSISFIFLFRESPAISKQQRLNFNEGWRVGIASLCGRAILAQEKGPQRGCKFNLCRAGI